MMLKYNLVGQAGRQAAHDIITRTENLLWRCPTTDRVCDHSARDGDGVDWPLFFGGSDDGWGVQAFEFFWSLCGD